MTRHRRNKIEFCKVVGDTLTGAIFNAPQPMPEVGQRFEAAEHSSWAIHEFEVVNREAREVRWIRKVRDIDRQQISPSTM